MVACLVFYPVLMLVIVLEGVGSPDALGVVFCRGVCWLCAFGGGLAVCRGSGCGDLIVMDLVLLCCFCGLCALFYRLVCRGPVPFLLSILVCYGGALYNGY